MKNSYLQIAKAIAYRKEKPSAHLDEVAKMLGLPPSAFHKIFEEWVGISPKKFFRFVGTHYTKSLLEEKQNTLFDTDFKAKLPKSTPLVRIEKMKDEAYDNLYVNYSFAESPFGLVTIASTSKGICSMAFDDEKTGLENLKAKFPKAILQEKQDEVQQNALLIFRNDSGKSDEIKLHVRGTDFQLKVWEKLLEIPLGELSTYGRLATKIGEINVSRAVGTAVGRNPVAYLIPCHRVVRTTGELGGYMWGKTRKTAIIAWEGAKIH